MCIQRFHDRFGTHEYQLADAFILYLKEKKMYAKRINGTRNDIGTKEFWVETF